MTEIPSIRRENVQGRNLEGRPRRSTRAARYLRIPLLSALVIALADSLALLLRAGFIPATTLILVLFLEGGLGLLVGVGISLSASPSVSKVGETLFGTAAWSRDDERHAERVAWRWMLGSAFLVLIGFLLSIAKNSTEKRKERRRLFYGIGEDVVDGCEPVLGGGRGL